MYQYFPCRAVAHPDYVDAACRAQQFLAAYVVACGLCCLVGMSTVNAGCRGFLNYEVLPHVSFRVGAFCSFWHVELAALGYVALP